ncbi:hypothetical protein GCM10023063_23730 [Arthrobacter methylotrophus]
MTIERTAKFNALTALLRSVDLAIDARKPLTDPQITEISHWRTRDEALAAATARAEAIRLAKRITILDTELLEASPAAALLDEKGIGPVIAAVVYTAWSHLGRVRSEAAFAALAGVAHVYASRRLLSSDARNDGPPRIGWNGTGPRQVSGVLRSHPQNAPHTADDTIPTTVLQI